VAVYLPTAPDSATNLYFLNVFTLLGLSATERVKEQRKILERQLGLTVGDTSLGVASNDLFL